MCTPSTRPSPTFELVDPMAGVKSGTVHSCKSAKPGIELGAHGQHH